MAETSSQAFLEAIIGSERRRFPLTAGVTCLVGRGDQNTIVLDDTQVSRRHALIEATPEREFYLIDLGSRNGTFVNQRRVTAPRLLQPGDRITIGSCEFAFHGACEAAGAQPQGQLETVVEFAQRWITTLVADIRDFTGWSSRLPEAKLSELISAFTRDSGLALSQQGACAQKYIGDAVMAFWLHRTDSPELSELISVFEALARLFDIAAGLQARFGLEAAVRIGSGINTGLACVGNMGSEASPDYTALSDAVNLTFRLESATKELGCDLALGRKTYELVSACASAADLFQPHLRTLKGYPEPKPVYAAKQGALALLVPALREHAEKGLSHTVVLPVATAKDR